MPTGTVTFLLTDVEGSTRLWDQHREAMRAALAQHDLLIEDLVSRFGGVMVRPRGEGDSRFAVFQQASAAVTAAGAIQLAFHRVQWLLPEPLRARLGLHTGEADLRDGDYYGSAVNRCARLRAIAYGGQVLLSQTTASLVRDQLPAEMSLRGLGVHHLRGLAEPERIFQLVHPELTAEFPELVSVSALSGTLPPPSTPLIGRERQQQEILDQLRRPETRLVTLTGPGGVGKTRLGVAVAQTSQHTRGHTAEGGRLRQSLADEVVFVDLAPVADASRVLSIISEALGILGSSAREDLLPRLHEAVHDRSLLLVLDNFEHVIDAAPDVGKLLAVCPAVKVLVTSRAPLRIRGEVQFPVPPLQVPRLARLPGVDELAAMPAVALFLERARAVRPDFELDAYTAPVVAELCVRLDGLPLAIELAAARSKLLSPHALLARLQERLDILGSSARDHPARQHTLRQAIGWSYDLLSKVQQSLFQHLAVFVSGWTLDAAEAVCDVERVATNDVLEVMGELVDNSLVVPDLSADGRDRYRLLETLRQYALEKLGEGEAAGATRQRHARYFQRVAEEAERALSSPEARTYLTRLIPDRDNLRTALEWSLEYGEPEQSARLATVLWEVLEQALGRPSIGRPTAESAADPLTAREREVAALIARGYSNRAIAEELVIGLRTAETHVEHILGKLGFMARAQIGAWAAERGLVPSGDAR
jgi:predicted ATPase/class 3 adenylate cyclase/DNA-binding CsgD family transcriptional regulator